jgi:hypothetical protein
MKTTVSAGSRNIQKELGESTGFTNINIIVINQLDKYFHRRHQTDILSRYNDSMEKPMQTIAPHDLQPPKESHTSIVLNSVGNGMMLGAIPFIAFEAHSAVTGKPLSNTLRIGSIAATVVGGVLGWVFGEKEANRLQHYRQAVSDEIIAQRAEIQSLKEEKHNWQTQVREPSPEKSEGILL